MLCSINCGVEIKIEDRRITRVRGDKAHPKRGETVTEIEISSTLQPGHVSLPNGTGLTYPDVADDADLGISPNELTSEEDRDWFAGTPWHKHVRARLEKV